MGPCGAGVPAYLGCGTRSDGAAGERDRSCAPCKKPVGRGGATGAQRTLFIVCTGLEAERLAPPAPIVFATGARPLTPLRERSDALEHGGSPGAAWGRRESKGPADRSPRLCPEASWWRNEDVGATSARRTRPSRFGAGRRCSPHTLDSARSLSAWCWGGAGPFLLYARAGFCAALGFPSLRARDQRGRRDASATGPTMGGL